MLFFPSVSILGQVNKTDIDQVYLVLKQVYTWVVEMELFPAFLLQITLNTSHQLLPICQSNLNVFTKKNLLSNM